MSGARLLTDIHVRTVFVIGRRTHRGRGKRELVLDVVRPAARCLPVGPEAARANVLLVAALASVGSLVRVQPLVQLKMDKLGELCGTKIAGVRLLAGVQSKVGLQVRGRAEPLLAYLALVRLFA